MAKRNSWTDDDIATLTAMVAIGKSHAEIGTSIGRTRGAVARKAHELGVKSSGKWAATLERRSLYEQGVKFGNVRDALRPSLHRPLIERARRDGLTIAEVIDTVLADAVL